jgi:hypothetical protein
MPDNIYNSIGTFLEANFYLSFFICHLSFQYSNVFA